MHESEHVPIASFLHDVEFDRYRGIADMAGLAGDPPPVANDPTQTFGETAASSRNETEAGVKRST
jgi:hypothetical protein